jgi:hypothetical protein
MAQIILEFRDDLEPRIVNSLCNLWAYKDKLNGKPNPEGKTAFIQRKVLENFKFLIAQGESKIAREKAILEISVG